jgi:hypothetical protein
MNLAGVDGKIQPFQNFGAIDRGVKVADLKHGLSLSLSSSLASR